MPCNVELRDDVLSPKPGGQVGFWNDWASEVIALQGGWGAGKTWIGSRKLLTLHVYNGLDDRGRPTGVPSACVAPTYSNAMDYDVPALLDAAEQFGIPAEWRSSDKNIVFPGTPFAEIKVRTADRPERITGWEVGAAWGDEAARWKVDNHNPRNDPIAQLSGRVRHPRARLKQIIYTYTNEGDSTKVYRMFREGREGYALYTALTKDNDVVSDFYEKQKASLTEELAAQYLDGGAISIDGANVYRGFGDVHISDKVQLSPALPVCVAVDFNIRPGMHALIGQHHKDTFMVAHEVTEKRMTVGQCATAVAGIVMESGRLACPTIDIYGDSAGHSSDRQTGISDYMMFMNALHAAGIPSQQVRLRVPKSAPSIHESVNAVHVAMMDKGNGVGLLIHPSCDGMIKDMREVRWDKDGKGIDKKDEALTHYSDALRYWINFVAPVRREGVPRGVGGRVVVG